MDKTELLKEHIRELSFALPCHTNLLRGGGHGRRLFSGSALDEIRQKIEELGGTETLETVLDTIRPKPETGFTPEEIHQRLLNLSESL